ncbi:ABC transporter permease [Herbaspirillum sp. alder98]|uniref:ABC transporter permease n=1 Tax=Herbaspirillum sp. alder98 TaxID=2913096 RepID=UPI001CD86103|nr:ABC transporter permease [Herbaspirillum sp. alder98]MCA1326035.1 ABC transporter permease [Herbaspirillum sp. alder98]
MRQEDRIDRHPIPRALRGWVLPLGLVFLWWLAAYNNWSTSPLLVPPAKVWDTAVQQLLSGDLARALYASVRRDLIGLAIGVSAGLVFGTAFGLSRLFERMIGPSFHTVKQISLFAWIPLLSVWFGLGDAAKVAFLSLAAFFPVVLNTFEGIRSVPGELIEAARVLKFTRVQWLTKLVLPAAAPSILAGFHLALVYAWLATLGAEYLLVSGQGIGNTMIDGRELFLMDLVIFGVIVVGFVGFALNWLAARLETRLLAWRGRSVAQFQ